MRKTPLMSTATVALAVGLALTGCATTGVDSSQNGASSQEANTMASAVTITDAWVKAIDDVSGMMPMTSFFMLVTNNSDRDVVITSGSVPADLSADAVETHEVVSNTSGDMVMQEAEDGITIPARSSVKFSPGTFHMMMLNLVKPILVGDTVTLSIVFADGSTTEVTGTAYSIANGQEKYSPEAKN